MNIVFIGSVIFSKRALKILLKYNINVIGIITKKSSSINSDFVDLSFLAKKHHIDFIYWDENTQEEIVHWVQNKQCDYIFCFGWSHLLPKSILDIPKKFTIGYHPTALPLNRGRHPLIWALVLGLKKSASTYFIIDKNADSGDILSQMAFKIKYKDDAKTLYNKVNKIALKQLKQMLIPLEKGKIKRITQNDKKANYWRKRNQKDGIIDFRMTSYAIYNTVRALTKPFIGAHIMYQNQEVKIWETRELRYKRNHIEPGTIMKIKKDHSIMVKTYDGAILLTKHEFNPLPKKGEYL
jgi:methionyl-tRNA formyltransferase